MRCDEAQEMLMREDSGRLSLDEQRTLVAHLAACAGCRDMAREQRMVAEVLVSRVDAPVPPGFADRVLTVLDTPAGWLALADWRRWTLRFAPVAAGLTLAALLVPSATIEANTPELEQIAQTFALDDQEGDPPVTSLFWQPEVDGDTLLAAAVTGSAEWVSGEAQDEP